MHCTSRITEDLYYVGSSDRRLALFENVYPIPGGVSYNSYLLLDEKTVLFDTVDRSVGDVFFENIAHVLGGRSLDYVVVDHVEPDHCGTLAELLLRWPDAVIVCGAKAKQMIEQFFPGLTESRCRIVKEGETLDTGRHALTFMMAPMVHWPEVMVTYDATDGLLFSADAFGTFGALSGCLFADQVDFERNFLDEARRYYTNIVGKYGPQVQALLKKAAKLDIRMLLPLHGPLWRRDISWFIDKYVTWSTCAPEEKAVVIAYASVYGHTENTVNILASLLSEKGIDNIRVYDVSSTHASVIVSECFRASHLVFASTTYNAGVFVNMENALHDIAAHALKNRDVALIENGTWAPTSGGLMKGILSGLKDIRFIGETLTLKSALREDQMEALEALASEIAASMQPAETEEAKAVKAEAESRIDNTAMFKLSYGLFVLTARDGEKDNGCIINTVTQITDSPKRISIAVNRANYTHDIIRDSGVFNVSILTVGAEFSLFQRFGFQSGRTADKFDGFTGTARSSNGLLYLTESCNAFLSAKVVKTVEYETHTVFLAEITEARTLSDEASVTYAYYFSHIKPKPPKLEEKKGWVCKICGYIYEGDELPPDFVCPLCKHGAEDFERLK